MGAVFIAPELEIDEEEAKILGKATADVASHYNVIIDEKTQAWVSLCVALSAVYGPRMFALYHRFNEPKRKQPARAEDENVVNLHGASPVV